MISPKRERERDRNGLQKSCYVIEVHIILCSVYIFHVLENARINLFSIHLFCEHEQAPKILKFFSNKMKETVFFGWNHNSRKLIRVRALESNYGIIFKIYEEKK